MARLRYLVNEGDEFLSALYIDDQIALASDLEFGMTVEEVLPFLVGKTIETVTLENTNLPFFDDDENPIADQRWPQRIPPREYDDED